MSDKDQIQLLLDLATNADRLQAAQHIAARKLLDFDGEVFPSDGCAITLSILLQQSGIDVPDVFKAIELGAELKNKRGWTIVDVGQQQAGDVGSTCGDQADHGSDHIYLVLQPLNSNEMVIADNQAPTPHFRFVNGNGKTPTRFFLRAGQ